MSNKEIAAALFLSPKTVEHHLSSVYRKRGFALARSSPGRSVRPRMADPRGYPRRLHPNIWSDKGRLRTTAQSTSNERHGLGNQHPAGSVVNRQTDPFRHGLALPGIEGQPIAGRD
jgi:hypothetical protein